ncbi:MAG: STAS domain-containing protein [Magnetococcales bacterium]|nr:STAS domain-containing protein [Magnetococcales bacterium]NGZ26896.1 STAS domain-containing protein [Magnetococcales bacterium]
MEITLEGDFTIERADALHNRLQEALQQKQPVSLFFAGMGYADMSFFQIIHAARQSFANKRITLTLQPDLPQHLSHKATLCGLGYLVPSQ